MDDPEGKVCGIVGECQRLLPPRSSSVNWFCTQHKEREGEMGGGKGGKRVKREQFPKTSSHVIPFTIRSLSLICEKERKRFRVV